MRKLTVLMFVCIILSAASCGDKNMTPSGYKVTRHLSGNGTKPTPGEMAFVHVYAYVDGKLQTSTRENDRVMPIRVNSEEELLKTKDSGTPNPIYEAIAVMSVGDSISVFVPVTEEMKKQPQMKDATEMRYDIVMLESKSQDAYQAEQKEAKERIEAEIKATKARESEIAAQVTEVAAQYRAGKLKDQLTATASGLQYMKIEEGEGPATQSGQKVSIHYYGTLTNGESFDNTFRSGMPFTFPLGAGRIRGWDEGLALLKGGDKAFLFVPSELGYGKAGNGAKIPGDSELIFYIEVL